MRRATRTAGAPRPSADAVDIRRHLAAARERLAGTDDPGASPRLEAELLLARTLEVSRSFLFAHPEQEVPFQRAEAFRALVRRRADGEPLAYITGEQEFWSLPLAVNPDVLIPRAETERLVEVALTHLPEHAPQRVADIGTGSGAIALALARERPLAEVLGTDISPAAVETARDNARRLALVNVRFALGAWCAPLEGERWDLVVSNPPYLAQDDPHLARGDCRFEPRNALTPGPDALAAYRAIIHGAAPLLRPGGGLLFEHGPDQGAAVRALLLEADFEAVETRQDLLGHDRVTGGRRSA